MSITFQIFFSVDDEEELDVKTSRHCKDNFVWLPMTDYQEEGNFIDVSNYSDEAIFDHEYLVGEPLKQVSEIHNYFKISKVGPEIFSQS